MICDTSGLLSAHIAGQPHHERSIEALNTRDLVVVPPLVLCELDYLTTKHHGRRVSERILRELGEPEYEIPSFSQADLVECLRIMKQYSDLDIGLTDASLVVLAKTFKTSEILTLDQRHFRAMRGLDGRHFRLLPFDLDE